MRVCSFEVSSTFLKMQHLQKYMKRMISIIFPLDLQTFPFLPTHLITYSLLADKCRPLTKRPLFKHPLSHASIDITKRDVC